MTIWQRITKSNRTYTIRSEASIVTGNEPSLKVERMNVKAKNMAGTIVHHDQYHPMMMLSKDPFPQPKT
jgi:hypothetical protein